MEIETALATRPSVGPRGLRVNSFEDLWRLATAVVKGGFAPKGLETSEKVFACMAMGLELGLPPMASLRGIAVINGRPSVYGDTAMALVHDSGLLEYIIESVDGSGDARTATCKVKRNGRPNEVVRSFSVTDAKRAQLWSKAGPWSQYPDRMLQMRARGYALRDEFADVLQGMYLTEEAQDIEAAPADPRPIAVRVLDKVSAALEMEPSPPESPPPAAPSAPQDGFLASEATGDSVGEPERENATALLPAEAGGNPWDTIESLVSAVDALARERGVSPEVVEGCWKIAGFKAKRNKWSEADRQGLWQGALEGRSFFAAMTCAK